MNITTRRWSMRALGLLLLTTLVACLVPDVGYVGGVYEPTGYVYGSWESSYHVGPPSRGYERRREYRAPARAYRPAPESRRVPSIPIQPYRH